jgi:hypothetical protein
MVGPPPSVSHRPRHGTSKYDWSRNREQRTAECPVRGQLLEPPVRGAEPVLEHAGEPRTRAGGRLAGDALGGGSFGGGSFGGTELVELAEADHWRLLNQDADARPDAGQRLLVMRVRGSADEHQVGTSVLEQLIEAAIGSGYPMLGPEGCQPTLVSVAGSDDHCGRPSLWYSKRRFWFQGCHVDPGDAASPRERDPDWSGWHGHLQVRTLSESFENCFGPFRL